MSKPASVYTKRIRQFEEQSKSVKKQLFVSSMLRLALFLLTCLMVYFLWGAIQGVLLTILLFFILFFTLVKRHVNLQALYRQLEALIQINKTELSVLNGNFSHLPDGSAFIDSGHPFSQDVDLFGPDSFFQYLNRTALEQGKKALANMLTQNQTQDIVHKQDAIKELSEALEFRQYFSASAMLSTSPQDTTASTPLDLLETLDNHRPFTPPKTILLASLFSGISGLIILLYFVDLMPISALVIWLFIGIGITGLYAKRVNALSGKVDTLQKTFQSYHKLVHLLENLSLSSALMCQLQSRIQVKEKKASIILKDFSRAIDALDQRNNLLFGFLGNGFLLWDLRQSYKLENWLKMYLASAKEWFKVLATVDAYNSLGNFAFNHPDYIFPSITQNSTLIKATQAVHPLIPASEAVTNDYTIERGEFFIITGANMAGKSTFLRTVSLQIIMSNTGLPVRAASCQYTPIKLITSMRTADSLAKEASYFYAELARLKFIIDRLQAHEYFIVLDEILKGTNSKDKALGSQKFLEKLVSSQSSGIIATHDLSLCKVAQETDRVKNYYFDAQIIDNELYFDYKFKSGICQNMNASFLLKKMQIID